MPVKPIKHQRGAIGLMGALTLLLVILFTALAVDSARIWMVKRKLQVVADMAAIEAASSLGCNATLSDVKAKASSAALANGYTEDITAAPNVVEIGNVVTTSGRRQFVADGTTRAVHVVATKRIPTSLIARGFFNNDVLLSAQAVSLPNVPLATFSLGTTAASLNTEKSVLLNALLGQMLGTPINLDLVSYQGFANSNLTLFDLLKAQGQILSVEDLLATQFTAGELLTLVSNAIGLRSDAVPGVVNDVLTLVDAATHDTKISLGQILRINENSQAEAMNVKLNVLNLITSIVSVSNGTNTVSIPLEVNLPGLLSVNANVQIIEPPQTAIGPAADRNGSICTFAKSAQLRVSVTTLVNLLLATVDLSLNVQAASGIAGLRMLKGSNNTTDLTFDAETNLVSVSLTNGAHTAPATISVLSTPLAEIGLNLAPLVNNTSVVSTGIDRPLKDNLPHDLFVAGSTSKTFAQLFSEPSAITAKLLGLDLGGVVTPIISTLVTPLLVLIANLLLDPLLSLLGISLANMDIVVEDVMLTNPNPLVI